MAFFQKLFERDVHHRVEHAAVGFALSPLTFEYCFYDPLDTPRFPLRWQAGQLHNCPGFSFPRHRRDLAARDVRIEAGAARPGSTAPACSASSTGQTGGEPVRPPPPGWRRTGTSAFQGETCRSRSWSPFVGFGGTVPRSCSYASSAAPPPQPDLARGRICRVEGTNLCSTGQAGALSEFIPL